MPGPHASQAPGPVAPASAPKVPAGQSSQAALLLDPTAAEKVPGAQETSAKRNASVPPARGARGLGQFPERVRTHKARSSPPAHAPRPQQWNPEKFGSSIIFER